MLAIVLRLTATSLRQRPISRAVSVCSMATILVLAGLLLEIVSGFSSVLDDVRSSRWVTLYLSPAVTESQELVVLSGIEKIPGVQNAQLVSKDAFISNFQKFFPSLAKGLSDLELDTIPRYIKVKADANQVETLRKKAAGNRSIEQVESNETRFAGLIGALGGLKWFSIALLVGIAVAGITLIVHRNQVRSRFQDQLKQTLLDLGANRVLRALPGIIEGAAEGLLAGALAAAILAYGTARVHGGISQLFATMGYESYPTSSYTAVLLVLCLGFFSGTIGSVWAQLSAKK